MERVITSTESPGHAGPGRTTADGVAGSTAEPAQQAGNEEATDTAVADAADNENGAARRGRRSASWRGRADRWLRPITLLVLIALLPPLLMVRRILQSTELNYQDYWTSLLRFTNPDGSLHVRGLFTYQNEHPFLIPQAIFYLDARLLNGTNHELGFFSLLMALASLAIIWLLLPRSWNPLIRGLLLVAASAAMFCPSGAWNFVRGMSGTAWLTANVFALLAILLAYRGRTVLAVLVAALALLTYGTGFGVPVALIVVALLRRDRRWRWLLPLGLLVGALLVYKATSQGGTAGGHGHDPGLLTQAFLTNLATLWDPSGGSMGLLLGAAGLVVLVMSAMRYWSAREQFADLVPWWGVLAYSLAASALISYGRNEAFGGNGAQGRYVSLSALFWIALAVVAVRTVTSPRELLSRGLAVAAAVLVFWGASPQVFSTAVSRSAQQDEVAAALRFNATDPFGSVIYQPQQQIPRLKGLHAYPFTSDYTVGCGLKPDSSIDLSKVRTLPAGAFPSHGVLDGDTITGNTRQVRGWVYRLGSPTQCAILVDSSGKVVGGGSAKIPRGDVAAIATSYPGDAGFDVVTPASNTSAQLILGFSDGFWKLPSTAFPEPDQSGSGTGSSGP